MSNLRLWSSSIVLIAVGILISKLLPSTDITASSKPSPLVHTVQGPVRGYIEEGSGHSVFLGVRYADTTGGNNRWRALRLAPKLTEVFNATQFSPACPQLPVLPYMTSGIGEDCLSVNIWAPAEPVRLPVVIYNYGGAMVHGSNSNPVYNGSAFASSGLIYVALNHRSGMFGFPHSRTMNGTSQNFGILDVFAAIDWVQKNIHSFGGDPDKITFMGQSSGGVMVDHYLWNYPEECSLRVAHSQDTDQTQTNIKAAIIQSADVFSGPGYAPENVGFDALAPEVGCPVGDDQSQLDCLRSKSMSELMTENWLTTYQTWFVPVIDGHTRFADYPSRFAAGKYAKHVPVLTGNTDDEATLFSAFVYPASQTTPFTHWINTFNADAAHIPDEELIEHYPASDYTSTSLQSTQLYSNMRFYCAIDYMIDLRAGLGNHYQYRFMHKHGIQTGFDSLSACHGCENPFIFKQYDETIASEVERQLAALLHETWVSFMLDPQSGPGWPATSKSNGTLALLGEDSDPLNIGLVGAARYNAICQDFHNLYQKDYPVLIDPCMPGAY